MDAAGQELNDAASVQGSSIVKGWGVRASRRVAFAAAPSMSRLCSGCSSAAIRREAGRVRGTGRVHPASGMAMEDLKLVTDCLAASVPRGAVQKAADCATRAPSITAKTASSERRIVPTIATSTQCERRVAARSS